MGLGSFPDSVDDNSIPLAESNGAVVFPATETEVVVEVCCETGGVKEITMVCEPAAPGRPLACVV